MTVSKLTEKLPKYDPNMEVKLGYETVWLYSPSRVKLLEDVDGKVVLYE